MRREGLVWENGPNVSVNANSSDSHYEPTAEHPRPSAKATSSSSISGAASTNPGSDLLRHHLDRRRRPRAHEQGTAHLRHRPQRARRRHRRRRAGLRARTAPSADSRPTMPPAPSSAPPASGEFFTHRTGHNIAQETARLRRAPRQSRNPRRAPHPAQHLLLRRARHLSARVRRAQRSQHAHRPRQSLGHRPHPAGTGAHLVKHLPERSTNAVSS